MSFCSAQAFTLTFTLMNTYGWLAFWMCLDQNKNKSLKFWARFGVVMSKFWAGVAMQIILAMITIWSGAVSFKNSVNVRKLAKISVIHLQIKFQGQRDGFTGSCYIGLDNISSDVAIYSVIFISLSIILVRAVMTGRNAKHDFNSSNASLLPSSKDAKLLTPKMSWYRHAFDDKLVVSVILLLWKSIQVVLHSSFDMTSSNERRLLETKLK
jgi:hypothetical protein